jgi:hypothetical protein
MEGINAWRGAMDLVANGFKHVGFIGTLKHELHQVGHDPPIVLSRAYNTVGAHQREALAPFQKEIAVSGHMRTKLRPASASTHL